MIKLTIVSPCYNEEEILSISAKKILEVLDDLIKKRKITQDSCWLCVNDGSKDKTWDIITTLHKKYPSIRGLNLAHNVGHQYAIMAGMLTAKDWSDAIITIDADLQDDVNCIEQMIDAYNDGYDVVYGVKVSRKADPLLKRISAQAFYKLQEFMGVCMVYNHADFRFLSKRVLTALESFPERNLYLRGLIPMIGFPSTLVEDVISEREAGVSKYTLSKMLNLALDGITSFSVKTLYLVTQIGMLFFVISFCIGIYVAYSLIVHSAVQGWASLMLSIWFVGGAILVAIGIVGTYVGKIYGEVKGRPKYIVQDLL